MTKTEILEELYKSITIETLINSFTKDEYYRQELRSELFLALSEKDETFLINKHIQNKIEIYVQGILYKMFNSCTHSRFYKDIKKPRQKVTDDINKECYRDSIEDPVNNFEQLAENALQAVKKLPEWDKIIFNFMYEGLNIGQIAKQTGINRRYVSLIVNRIRKDLKSQIRKEL